MTSVRWVLRNIVYRVRYFLKARVPEKFLVIASYVSNALFIAVQYLFLREFGGESNTLVMMSSIAVAAQLAIPFYIMDFVPIIHYIVLLSLLAAGVSFGLVDAFPVYYYFVSMIVPFSLLKMEPVLTTSAVVAKVGTKVSRAFKKARVPRSREELIFNAKVSSIYVGALTISILVYVLTRFTPSIVVALYNLGVILFIMLNVSVNPSVRIPKEKYSLTLLFVLRYPLLFRLVNKMKMKLHPLTEKAGIWIYEVEFLSKYVATFFIYVMLFPTLVVSLVVILPPGISLAVTLPLLLFPAILYYLPFISMKNRISKRKQMTEKEYPIFVAYASTMISAGISLYNVFKDLASGKGSELLKGFRSEAKYITSLVEKQGVPEAAALERYAAHHPSQEVRNFILGYIHQLQLGGKISQYLEQKLSEALDITRRRMENFVRQVVMLTEIAITVLVLPLLPTILGFIMSPDLMYNMLFVQMFIVAPFLGFLFYNVASVIQPEFRDEYRFTFIPSVVCGVISLFASLFLVPQKVLAGVAIVVAGIAVGYYIEFVRQRKIYAEIERMLPQFFRDLSELRSMLPVSEAIKKMTQMNYPRNFVKILRACASLREQGLRITEQPWHSKSWFWKFTQFLVGKVEESGGGTPQIFRQLMVFFTEYNNIMYSIRSSLRIYEMVIYAIPVIFGIVVYTTIGIFSAIGTITGEIMAEGEALAGLGIQFPQFTRMLRGVDPFILTICDILLVEMSFILGLLSGKIVSGTLRDTKALTIAMIISACVVVFMPYLLQMHLSQLVPQSVRP